MFFSQLFALLINNLKRKLRSPLITVVELLLPPAFIFGLICFWLIAGVKEKEAQNFVPFDAIAEPVPFVDQIFWHVLCIKEEVAPPPFNISELPIEFCNSTQVASEHFECFASPFIPKEFNTRLCSTIPGIYVLLGIFTAFNATPRFVPTLDEVIVSQWIASAALPDRLQRDSDSLFSSLTGIGLVHYVPDTALTRNLARFINKTSSFYRYVHGSFFATEEAALLHIKKQTPVPDNPIEEQTWALIVVHEMENPWLNVSFGEDEGINFDSKTNFSNVSSIIDGLDEQAQLASEAVSATRHRGFKVALRMNRTIVPSTTNLIDSWGTGVENNRLAMYASSGTLTLQQVLSNFYASEVLQLNTSVVIDDIKAFQGAASSYGKVKFARTLEAQIDALKPNIMLVPPAARPQLQIQLGTMEAILQMLEADTHRPKTAVPLTLNAVAPMPVQPMRTTQFLLVAGQFCPLALVLSFLFSVSQLTKRIVEEKEQRIREAMYIMGLGSGAFYLSWVITYVFQNALSCAIMTVMAHFTISPLVDPLVLFGLFFLFSVSTVCLAGIFAAFFSQGRIAALLSPLIFFALGVPTFALPQASTGREVYLGLSVLSPCAFALGSQLVFSYELSNGLQAKDFFSRYDQVNMATVYLLLIGDIIFYSFFMLYVDAGVPSEWGTRKHPLFCFIEPIRWLLHLCAPPERAEDLHFDGRDVQGVYEKREVGEPPSVELQGLRKEFSLGGESIVAVNQLTLNLYPNEVTVLLAKNGGGKTTTINVMTGMLAPDGGDCLIYGKSIRHDLSAIRQDIGFCPQHNILWPDLTCREHLLFFAALKGLSGQDQEMAAMEMLEAVNLAEKANEYTGTLSGGQKRKLSVAIAFVAGNRMVFLDEPTAGMDVAARRFTWDLVKRMTQGRTILLTTHYMDEADLLGNSVAILGKGQLKCMGSPMFLKSRLGVGYTISMALLPAPPAQSQRMADQIEKLVLQHVPNADNTSHVAGEVTFRLPMANVPLFPKMLSELEARTAELNIQSYGVSVTTLEEIFLRIDQTEQWAGDVAAKTLHAKEKNPLEDGPAPLTSKTVNAEPDVIVEDAPDEEYHSKENEPLQEAQETEPPAQSERVEACPPRPSTVAWEEPTKVVEVAPPLWTDEERALEDASRARQFRALFVKRYHYAKRDYRTLFFQIVMPVLCIALALGLSASEFPQTPPLVLIGQPYLVEDSGSSLSSGGGFTALDVPLTACSASVAHSFNQSKNSKYLVTNISSEFLQEVAANSFKTFFPGESTYLGLAGDELVSMENTTTAFNMSMFLLAQEKSRLVEQARLFAVSCNDLTIDSPMLSGTQTNDTQELPITVLFVNSSFRHAAPLAFNSYLESIVRKTLHRRLLLESEGGNGAMPTLAEVEQSEFSEINETLKQIVDSFSWQMTLHPLPPTETEHETIDGYNIMIISIFVSVPFTFIPATYVAFIVRERECNAKHLQQLAGMSTAAYWFANFVFDSLSYLVTGGLTISLLFIFNRTEFVGESERFLSTLILIGLYGLAAITSAYVMSFAFDNHATGQNITMLVHFSFGFLLVLILFFLETLDATKDLAKATRWVARIAPSYCLGEGLMNLASLKLRAGFGDEKKPFDMEITGANLIYMAVEIGFFGVLATILDQPKSQQPDPILESASQDDAQIAEEDVDVSRERNEIDSGQREDDIVVVKNLHKRFQTQAGSKVAIKKLTLGVKTGEVFGFLGANGAGKSSTISIICNALLPTSGTAHVAGFDCVQDANTVRRLIGYTPQFDALHDLLTAEEHLRLYGGLRGLDAEVIERVMERLIESCDLQPHRHKPASHMSGGNRRKLSVALALIGGPKVIFLDEPSAGMDPGARRIMWAVIQRMASQSSVILTTHHLEEVEVLADRVGIMVSGELKCIGSLQHLKSKFGSGFEMSIRVDDEEFVEPLKVFVHEHFAHSELQECRNNKLTFALPSNVSLSQVFELIEGKKADYNITDYSVSQTTLESVFLRISGADAGDDPSSPSVLPPPPPSSP